MDRVTKLAEAERLLLEVRASLRKDSDTCPGCGGTRYLHWDEKTARDFVNAGINRIQRVQDMIERGKIDAEGPEPVQRA